MSTVTGTSRREFLGGTAAAAAAVALAPARRPRRTAAAHARLATGTGRSLQASVASVPAGSAYPAAYAATY